MNFYLIQLVFYYLVNYCYSTSIHNFQISSSGLNPTDDFKKSSYRNDLLRPLLRPKRGFGDIVDMAREINYGKKIKEGLKKTAQISVVTGKKINTAACKFWDSVDKALSPNYQGDLPCAEGPGKENGKSNTSPVTTGSDLNNTESNVDSSNRLNNYYNSNTNDNNPNHNFTPTNENPNDNTPNISNGESNDPNYYTDPSPMNPPVIRPGLTNLGRNNNSTKLNENVEKEKDKINVKERGMGDNNLNADNSSNILNGEDQNEKRISSINGSSMNASNSIFSTTDNSILLDHSTSISSDLFNLTLPLPTKNCKCVCPSTNEYEIIEADSDEDKSRIKFRLVKKKSPIIYVKRIQ